MAGKLTVEKVSAAEWEFLESGSLVTATEVDIDVETYVATYDDLRIAITDVATDTNADIIGMQIANADTRKTTNYYYGYNYVFPSDGANTMEYVGTSTAADIVVLPLQTSADVGSSTITFFDCGSTGTKRAGHQEYAFCNAGEGLYGMGHWGAASLTSGVLTNIYFESRASGARNGQITSGEYRLWGRKNP